MSRIKPPVVFLGPSISKAEAQAVLPEADYRPPAERGDLYRARFLGASILVLIDGVFLERYAPSPREMVDVVRDGALVLGAGSLGALRAAECWPVGMQGAGLIYRLFRAHRLHSDEEVALIYDAKAHRPLTVPLVNVRFATHRAVREGLLTPTERNAIVETAAAIFYDERTWPGIFAATRLELGAERRRFLEAIDLKKIDALRALTTVARWLERDASLTEKHLRRSQAPFVFAENAREAAADPLAGISAPLQRHELARWLLTSGRFRRYIAPLVAGQTLATPGGSMSEEEGLRADLGRVSRARTRRTASLKALLANFDEFAGNLWAELMLGGERDAELFRWHAVRQMAEQECSACPLVEHGAELEILAEHGFSTWDELEAWAAAHDLPREWFRNTRTQTASARQYARNSFAARCCLGGEG